MAVEIDCPVSSDLDREPIGRVIMELNQLGGAVIAQSRRCGFQSVGEIPVDIFGTADSSDESAMRDITCIGFGIKDTGVATEIQRTSAVFRMTSSPIVIVRP